MTFPRTIFIPHVSLAFSILAIAMMWSCTPGQRSIAKDALAIADTLCIIAHQELPDTDVAKACGIAGPAFGPMQKVLSEARTGANRAAIRAMLSAGCGSK